MKRFVGFNLTKTADQIREAVAEALKEQHDEAQARHPDSSGAAPTAALSKMTDRIRRRKFHRFVFVAAGIYNIAWGLYAAWDPQWLFRYSGLPLQNHPQIFACLGMVVGLYGIVYFEVARVPERGWLLAAVGLVGKVLGPIGLLQLIWNGTWPRSTIILSLTNDLIWWVPFAIYLYDAWPWFRQDVFSRR